MISIDDIDSLKNWLIKELEPICDADPHVLSKYIVALIKRDKEEDELKKKCVEQLEVFLLKETVPFVDKLLETLQNRSYEAIFPTGDLDFELRPDYEEQNSMFPADSTTLNAEKIQTDEIKPSHFQTKSSSRSRSREDKRKRSKYSRYERDYSRPRHKRYSRKRNYTYHKRKNYSDKKHCPDYAEKGFCVKGDSCPYSHGRDPLVIDKGSQNSNNFIPPAFPPFPGAMPLPMPPFPAFFPFGQNRDKSPVEGYNPENPGIDGRELEKPMKRETSSNIITLQTPRVNNRRDQSGPTSKRGRFTTWVKGRGTPNNTTVELRKVPVKLNTDDLLRNCFNKFGEIKNIQIGIGDDEEGSLITFVQHNSARDAISSPEPIFNNRFITIFWHAIDSQRPAPQSTTPTTESNPTEVSSDIKPAYQPRVMHQHPVLAKYSAIRFKHTQAYQEQQEVIKQRMIETAKKRMETLQANQQKKLDIKNNALKMKFDLIEKKTEIMEQCLAEQKVLLKKLEENKATLTPQSRKEIMDSLSESTKKAALLKSEINCMLVNSKPTRPQTRTMKTTLKIINNTPKAPAPVPIQKQKEDTQKELLDAELDLLNKQSNDDTTELEKKVIELKKEAISLGLYDHISPRTTRPQRPLPSPSAAALCAVQPPKFTSFRDTLKNLDHRPRAIEVSGFDPEDQKPVTEHFASLGKLQSFREAGKKLIFFYKTRKDAEVAASKGFKFRKQTLSVHWHKPETVNKCKLHRPKSSENIEEIDPVEELLYNDIFERLEEDEEDLDERSWRK